MITVRTTRCYPDATHYTFDQTGKLRVYQGDQPVAEYERGIEHEVTYTPDLVILPLNGELTEAGIAEMRGRLAEALDHP